MPDHMIGMVAQLHRRARLPLRPAGFRPLFFRSDLGAGFAIPSEDGGLEEFFEFWLSLAARSVTCACSSATCSRSSPITATWQAAPRSAHPAPRAAPATAHSRQHAARPQHHQAHRRFDTGGTTPRPTIRDQHDSVKLASIQNPNETAAFAGKRTYLVTPAVAQPFDPQKFTGVSGTGLYASLTCWNADHYLAVNGVLSAVVRSNSASPGLIRACGWPRVTVNAQLTPALPFAGAEAHGPRGGPGRVSAS